MLRLPTVAGLIGVLTGVWATAATVVGGATRHCPEGGCPSAGPVPFQILTMALGVGLICVSAISFYWRRRVFYGTAVLSALIAVSAYLGSTYFAPSVLWITTLLCLVSTAVSLLAARSENIMSEQGNPMNLPVFG